MIHVSGLTKDYGARRAISDLEFDAQKGEILGFLGPNGAGKTTTMRILTGYMPPTSGKVEIGGYDILEHSLEVRQLVGYLPETVPLYTDMTVFDYLHFMADLHRVKKADDRVDEVLELVHLEDRAGGYISKLSKGMRQRVGLAQALVHNPQVLILDEPTIGLDPAQIREVRGLITELGKDRTILLSTHILAEAQQICNRVMIINKGHIVAEDTPEGLQSMITGAVRARLQVRGDGSKVLELIKSIPGVISATASGMDTIEFDCDPGHDLRAEASRKVIQAGYDLLHLEQISMSLEDIFLQLTHEEPQAENVEEEMPDEPVADLNEQKGS